MFRQSSISAATQSDPYELFGLLPSHWKDAKDADSLKDYTFAVQQLHTAVYDAEEAVKSSLGIHSVLAAVAVPWYRIVIKESALASADNTIRYGTGLVYGQGSVYGQVTTTQFSWPVPAGLVEVGLVQDSVLSPSIVLDQSWVLVVGGSLVFRVNPFTLFQPVQVGTDREIYLWCRNALVDKRLPYLQYGAIIGVASAATDSYVESLRRLWDMALRGPSLEALSRAITAAMGLTYCVGDETVERVEADSDYLSIVTDKNVYRFHKAATALVSVGDSLIAGQSLTDTLRIADLSSGVDQNWALLADLAAFSVGTESSSAGGQLSFPNTDTSWAYWGADDVRCPVVGDSTVIEDFWQAVKSRGLASTTLAARLGMDSPATSAAVNPMRFILDVLGNNTVLVRVRGEHALALEIGLFKRIPSLLPPATSYLFWQEAAVTADSLALETFVDTVTVCPATVTVDTMSTSGYDLSFTDYAPLVTAL